ncbi:hypothetical protein K432DRAFT_430407 [Lepidopterella palustris CBS 459.81]|uniref:Myb-like domain-containing protein n=1 Tax=Lepidopterella palustris CBS 459.81 TaxID=1314670 RepID=A0A8E2DY01_9PEZI|nr:hypothetical protein K432DRAFT_430407 [Lepidopterella palustris CBS 459.81]
MLLEPQGSKSSSSKKSTTLVASSVTGATKAYPTVPQSPTYATASPAYAAASPAYPTASPACSTQASASSLSLVCPSIQNGTVLQPLPKFQQQPLQLDPLQHPQAFRQLFPGPHAPSVKRAASQTPLPEESIAEKRPKWTPEDDNLIIELRDASMKWDDIAKRFSGRTSIACRLRYQNYLEKRDFRDEEEKDRLARLYNRFKSEMWQKIASEMQIPWRLAESLHWKLGEQEMSARANAAGVTGGTPAAPHLTLASDPHTS